MKIESTHKMSPEEIVVEEILRESKELSRPFKKYINEEYKTKKHSLDQNPIYKVYYILK